MFTTRVATVTPPDHSATASHAASVPPPPLLAPLVLPRAGVAQPQPREGPHLWEPVGPLRPVRALTPLHPAIQRRQPIDADAGVSEDAQGGAPFAQPVGRQHGPGSP